MSGGSEAAVVELREVSRSFPSPGGPVHALRGVSLRVPRGALVALVGPSGSGKTSLLNLIGALDTPSAGELRVLGADPAALGEAGRAALRRRMGFVFQSLALLPTATAYENVELGLRLSRAIPRGEWERRARQALAAVGMQAWAQHRPYELSGGQQQRVAVARAIVARPALILADEPSGDLDAASGRRLIALLRALTDSCGATVVLSTHDPAVAAAASLVYQLRDGALLGRT